LPVAYRNRASWVLHGDIFADLAGLASTTNGSLAFPALQADPPILYGRPVYIADFGSMSTATRCGLFGDLSVGYIIRRVTAVGLKRLDEVASDSGGVVFRAFERVDAKPGIQDACRALLTAAS
jgi:HK97 family phage major capsid protein